MTKLALCFGWIGYIGVWLVGCNWELIGEKSVFKETARVHFVDVGQGDATVIEVFSYDSSSQKIYWIDGGGRISYIQDNAPFAMERWLKNNPMDTVEWVLITHGDRDHFEGIFALLRQSVVRKVYIPHELAEQTSFYWARALETFDSIGIPVEKIYRGHTLKMGEQSSFQVLWPTHSFVQSAIHSPNKPERNDLSYVGQFFIGEHKVLFTGDIGMEIEQRLLALGTLQSDVLKVAHHGSKNSSSLSFLAEVNPNWVVISSDPKVYGHPHIETSVALKRILQDTSRILRTDREGTISLQLNKNGIHRLF